MEILADPGFWCFNERAAGLYKSHGAEVADDRLGSSPCWRVRLPAGLVKETVAKAPAKIILGARNPENRLLLDAEVPRIYFGSGSETNVWLETTMEEFCSVSDPSMKVKIPRYRGLRGDSTLLGRAGHLCDQLEHLDFFIRPVNVQDPGITEDNHDVNKFFASLNNITKHVQAGLTKLESMEHVVRMAEIIAGGAEALRQNPIISFIACIFKSPLEMVDDTAEKVFAIVEGRIPAGDLVIASGWIIGSYSRSRNGGANQRGDPSRDSPDATDSGRRHRFCTEAFPSGPGWTIFHDLYGCPEFNQYNNDCVQLARHYRIPCYSTAGVADAKTPGMQAVFEKMLTHTYMAMSGAQYIHYAFGLLDRTKHLLSCAGGTGQRTDRKSKALPERSEGV